MSIPAVSSSLGEILCGTDEKLVITLVFIPDSMEYFFEIWMHEWFAHQGGNQKPLEFHLFQLINDTFGQFNGHIPTRPSDQVISTKIAIHIAMIG